MNKLLVLFIGLILMACNTRARKAQLRVVNPAVNLSTIAFDSTYAIKYVLHNNGSGNLVVDTVSASCGCTIPASTRFTIPPADSAVLVVNFKPAEPGAFDKKVIIKSNTDSVFSVVSFYGNAEK